MTTILGLMPLAFGIGNGAEMVQPLAIVWVGGLIYATATTLLLIPVMYRLIARRKMEKIADDELTWTTYQYRLKGVELEIAGYEFNNKWQDGLSINEIIYHL